LNQPINPSAGTASKSWVPECALKRKGTLIMAELNVKAVEAEVERTKEYLKGLIHSAFWGEDEEEMRQAWTEFLQLSMPEELKKEPYFLEDMVETNVMLRRDPWHGFFIDYGDKEYEAETVFEAQFLSYLTLALKRGTPFKEAWERATRILVDENKVTSVVYELTTDDDQYEVGLWTERLTGMGVESSEASELARKAQRLLRQIWLTREDGWYDEDMLSEADLDDRKILLEKLNYDPSPSTC